MKQFWAFLIVFLLFVPNAMAIGPGLVEVREADGTPSGWVKQITFTNGSLVVSGADAEVTTGGAAGQAVTLQLEGGDNPESADLGQITIINDTNSAFTENSADSLQIDLSVNWPTADTAEAGDSATSFFSAGTIEAARLPVASGSTAGIVPTSSGVADGWVLTVQADESLAYEVSAAGVTDAISLTDVAITDYTGGNILIGDNSDSYDQKAIGGDATLAATGDLTIADDAIEESMLKAVNAAADEDLVTYESTTGDFEYHTISEVFTTVTPVDGSLIDFSGITQSTDTNEGVILPTWANVTTTGLTNGAIAWDETTDAIKVKSASGWQSIGASAAPTDAQYLTLDTDATLSVERVLTAGAGIDFTDGGAGSTLTVAGETSTVTNPGIVELATTEEATTGTDTERAVTAAGVVASVDGGTFTPVGTWDISGATVSFGLVAGDIPDISATYEVQLTNSAGLYGVLSDETGSGAGALAVFNDNPTLIGATMAGDIVLGANQITSTGDVDVKLGDAAGTNALNIYDSGDTLVWWVNSDGQTGTPPSNNPYIVFDEDSGVDYYIGLYETTLDRLEFRRSSAANTNVDMYVDSDGLWVGGNINISTGHELQINGAKIDIADLDVTGDWTPTGNINLDSATLTLTIDSGNYTAASVDATHLNFTVAPDAGADNYSVTYDNASGGFTLVDVGGGTGDNVEVDSVAVVDPDFVSTGHIDFVNNSNEITANINDNVVDSGAYVNASIDAEHLAADIIDETKIADNGIDSEHYNDGSIDPEHLSIVADDDAIEFVIDGGGSAITAGVKGFLEIPFACTINSATALADQSGSIVVDIWVDTYANYPPTVADTITSATPVTITTATKSQDSTLTSWTTSLSKGDIIGYNVDSATTIERVTISLKVDK